jgi:hypothetical protein
MRPREPREGERNKHDDVSSRVPFRHPNPNATSWIEAGASRAAHECSCPYPIHATTHITQAYDGRCKMKTLPSAYLGSPSLSPDRAQPKPVVKR